MRGTQNDRAEVAGTDNKHKSDRQPTQIRQPTHNIHISDKLGNKTQISAAMPCTYRPTTSMNKLKTKIKYRQKYRLKKQQKNQIISKAIPWRGCR